MTPKKLVPALIAVNKYGCPSTTNGSIVYVEGIDLQEDAVLMVKIINGGAVYKGYLYGKESISTQGDGSNSYAYCKLNLIEGETGGAGGEEPWIAGGEYVEITVDGNSPPLLGRLPYEVPLPIKDPVLE